jgi:hypothetical protein
LLIALGMKTRERNQRLESVRSTEEKGGIAAWL